MRLASKTSVNGIPAICTQVLVNGKYSVSARIRRGLKPTTFAIAGSFNGAAVAGCVDGGQLTRMLAAN